MKEPVAVCWGAGVDSTTILIEMARAVRDPGAANSYAGASSQEQLQ